jgi:predicted SAM-dependent methyltransferase
MNIQTISFKGQQYPKFQTEGNASQFAIPYAKHVCKGNGYDIGCMKREWAFPGATPIDIVFDDSWDATHLPEKNVDFIFSSHCLEHLQNWVDVLDYWYSCLSDEGVLFLYLPDYSQEYWRPWHNRKHLNIFTPTIIKDYMEHKQFKNVFVSSVDLNNAFMAMGNK